MQRESMLMAVVYIVAVLMCSACNAGTDVMNTGDVSEPLDYSDDFCWVAQPEAIDKPVDVFYVYPTIYVGKDPVNMDIADPGLRANARGLIKAQGGVYTPHANMFAPFYRQETAALQSMEAGNGGRDAYADPAFQVGARDVERAFTYYLTHLNPDRPFILASHSQGTMTLINLMRKHFNDPALQKRLVAAYLIGYSVTREDLVDYPWMKPAQGAKDTGVIVTFNTEGDDAGPSPVLLPGAVAINPLNWRTDETPADPTANLGAQFFNDATGEPLESIDHFAGAVIDPDKGVVIATEMKTPQSEKIDLVHMGRWPRGVFHRYDYAFWFNNLTANVGQRIEAYLAIQQ